jgi:hypothetical protein
MGREYAELKYIRAEELAMCRIRPTTKSPNPNFEDVTDVLDIFRLLIHTSTPEIIGISGP